MCVWSRRGRASSASSGSLSTSLQFNLSEPFKQFEPHRPIIFHEEHVLTIVAALGYVMSDLTYNDSRYPRHDLMITSTTEELHKKQLADPYFHVCHGPK